MATGTVLYERKSSPLGSETEDSSVAGDTWDDRVLIEAYDEAAYLAKCRVAARLMSQGVPLSNGVEQVLQNGVSQPAASKKSKKKNRKGKVQWEVGAPCRAIFSEDGCEYEATVQSVNQMTGMVIVKYIGYNNVEEVPTTSLKPSQGATARQYQMQQTLEHVESDNATETDIEDPLHNGGTFGDMLPGVGAWTPPPRFVSYNKRGPSARQQFHNSQNRMNIPIPPPPPPHLISQFPDEDSEALSAMLLSWYMSGFHTGYYQGLREARNGPHNQTPARMPSRKK